MAALGNDALAGGAGSDSLIGGGGADRADYSTSGSGVTVNLATGLGTGGDAQGDTLSGIENLTGSTFDDVLTGDAGVNVLDGGAGNDILVGGTGADSLIGGAGIDRASYSASASGVTVNLATGTGVGGDAQGDTLSGIENLTGSAFDDALTGDTVANTLDGGAGDDTLVGGAGADSLIGGTGIDRADYLASATGIAVNLATGTGVGGDAHGDMLSGIENLTGSTFDDVLTGNASANVLDGGAGNDTLVGGAGVDSLIGGTGIDRADYSASATGITIDLAAGTSVGGDAQGDTLSGIENLTGSNYDDVLTGDAGANVLNAGTGNDYADGGVGNDIIYGGDGNDTLTGNYGTDQMYGEAGNDTFLAEWDEGIGDYYNGGDGIDTYKIDGTAVQSYALQIDLQTGTSQYHDTFISVENLIGGLNNDVFNGDAGVNQFWGRDGNDVLDGRGGNDLIYGEAGTDTLFGGDGSDLLDGGIGDDVLSGGAGTDNLIGGTGTDRADYSASATGVTANLATGAGSGGEAQGDTLSGIENLTGSIHNDVLTGDAGDNVLDGGAGDDTLAGGAGADLLVGGDGADIASYASSGSAVNINLFTGIIAGGDATGDIYSSIEGVTGSAFDDVIAGNAGANTLAGGAGVDTLDYSASDAAIAINLSSDTASGGFAEGDVIFGFENVLGSTYNDYITGNALANTIFGDAGDDMLQGFAGDDTLRGGTGNDRIYGGEGADIIDGGVGIDTADYRYSQAAVIVSLVTNTGTGGDAQGDILSGIENLAGSDFDDVLIGDAGNNRLVGNEGADKLYGGAGNDIFDTGGGYDFVDGGAGVDTVTYDNSWGLVVVNLATGKGSGAEAANDTYVNVEYVVGSLFDDVMTGDANVNRLNGLDGNDTLDGGAGNDILLGGLGADKLIGGVGDQDAASYQDATLAVIVNLALGGTGGEAAGDTYSGIEYVYGSAFNDQITGDGAINRLTGGAGQDILDGAAGNDYILGDAGNDTLIGGLGADVFVFEKGFGNDTISDFWTGVGRTDRVWFTGLGFDDFADVQANALDTAGGVVITLAGEGTLTFTGITLAQLNADDFIFS